MAYFTDFKRVYEEFNVLMPFSADVKLNKGLLNFGLLNLKFFLVLKFHLCITLLLDVTNRNLSSSSTH